MKQIVKDSSVLTAVSIGEMFMRFIRTKAIALILGPEGTGFLAQLAILFEALRVWGDLGSRRGVIKQVAEQRFSGNASPRYREVVKASFFLAILSSVLLGTLVAIFSGTLSRLLYGDSSHYRFIIFLAFLLPAASLSTVTASIVKGNLDYLSFAKYSLGAFAAVILCTPFLIYFFKIEGAVLTMGLFFIFPFFAYLFLNAKKKFLHFAPGINFRALREQFSQGFVQIYQDTLVHFVRISIAAWIVHAMGLSMMGIYQVVLTFSTVYMNIPLHALSGYVLPTIARAQENREINLAINESIRFLLFILVPIVVIVIVIPEFLISFFFSREFLPAVPVLQVQVFSTLFILMSYSYTTALASKGKLKLVFIISTTQTSLFFAVVGILFPKWKLMGIAIAYCISSLTNCLMHYGYARHYFGTRLLPKNVKLVAMSMIWAASAYVGVTFFDHLATRIFLLGLGFFWFFISSKDHEREFVFNKLSYYLGRLTKPKVPGTV